MPTFYLPSLFCRGLDDPVNVTTFREGLPRKTGNSEYDTPPPNNIDAERSVLGAIILENQAVNVAREKSLRPEDFFHDHHRKIFICTMEMADKQEAIDLVTLADALGRCGNLETVGGSAYLSQLIDGVPRISNLAHYIGILQEKATLRSILYSAHGLKQAAYDGTEDSSKLLDRAAADFQSIGAGRASTSESLFDTAEEFESTPEATYSVAGFLQDYSVTAIAGLSENGKTWVSLNVAAALLFGPGKLWDLFDVPDRAEKIIYLIPEASRSTFKTRLKLMGLYNEIGKRLFVRTLTKGPTIPLAEPNFLRTVKGAHVICDTAIRFMKAIDENSASEAANGLSDDFFALQRAEAKSVMALFHSPKSFAKDDVMSLENMIRGSSEFGAALATGWGIRQIDRDSNTIHVSNIKARDFARCADFQLIGRPHIDKEGSFRLHRRPGMCGRLSEYLDELRGRNRGGASEAVRQGKATNKELLREWLTADPLCSSKQLAQRFHNAGTEIDDSTIRRYRKELGL